VHLGRATDNLVALAARPLPLEGAAEPERDTWLAAARAVFADLECPSWPSAPRRCAR